MEEANNPKFVADENVGGLAKLLRLLGFDTTFFKDGDDSLMVETALEEKRIVLTRDTRIPERRVITRGLVKLILIRSDLKFEQLKQVEEELDLKGKANPFSLCLECNRALQPVSRENVRDRVPPYVFQTQKEYMECPRCRRVYWKGTHWQAMTIRLLNLNMITNGVINEPQSSF